MNSLTKQEQREEIDKKERIKAMIDWAYSDEWRCVKKEVVEQALVDNDIDNDELAQSIAMDNDIEIEPIEPRRSNRKKQKTITMADYVDTDEYDKEAKRIKAIKVDKISYDEFEKRLKELVDYDISNDIVYVDTSNFLREQGVDGLGLYAKRKIRKGEYICTYGGKRVSRKQTNPKAYDTTYTFSLDSKFDIDATTTDDGYGRYVNDAIDLNKLNSQFKGVDDDPIIKSKIILVATKRIKAGDEILASYSQQYWKSRDRRELLSDELKDIYDEQVANNWKPLKKHK